MTPKHHTISLIAHLQHSPFGYTSLIESFVEPTQHDIGTIIRHYAVAGARQLLKAEKLQQQWNDVCKGVCQHKPSVSYQHVPVYAQAVQEFNDPFSCFGGTSQSLVAEAQSLINAHPASDITSTRIKDGIGLVNGPYTSTVVVYERPSTLPDNTLSLIVRLKESFQFAVQRASMYATAAIRLARKAESERRADRKSKSTLIISDMQQRSMDGSSSTTVDPTQEPMYFNVPTRNRPYQLPNPLRITDGQYYTCSYYHGPLGQMPWPPKEVFGTRAMNTLGDIMSVLYELGLPQDIPFSIRVAALTYDDGSPTGYRWLLFAGAHEDLVIDQGNMTVHVRRADIPTAWTMQFANTLLKDVDARGTKLMQPFIQALAQVK